MDELKGPLKDIANELKEINRWDMKKLKERNAESLEEISKELSDIRSALQDMLMLMYKKKD